LCFANPAFWLYENLIDFDNLSEPDDLAKEIIESSRGSRVLRLG
jgi:hypothetical protein